MWAAGVLIPLVALIGGIIGRDRQVWRAISEGDNGVKEAMSESQDRLHARIDKVREEYVRRDDLEKHQESIEHKLDKIHDDMREINRRFDAFFHGNKT